MNELGPYLRNRSMIRSAIALCFALSHCGTVGAGLGTLPAAVDRAVSDTALGDAAQPTSQIGSAAALINLTRALTVPITHVATNSGLGTTPGCRLGYMPPSSLIAKAAAPMPPSGGIFYSHVELSVWRTRIGTGPFVRNDDHMPGSPGDWHRIVANTKAAVDTAESPLTSAHPAEIRDTHGTLARDAAFHFLVTGDSASGHAARAHLLSQARNPANDFASNLCIITLDGNTHDAWFRQAAWLLRHAVIYDFVRRSMPANHRLLTENWFRRQAYFLAAHTDWGLSTVFPNRLSGDYTVKRDAAAATSDHETWYARRFDTNGDCTISDADQTTAMRVSAYVRADGSVGPRISVLSQYYNNRKSAAAVAFGAVGALLAEPVLIVNAKRYFMEWLAYSVWPDGSQGESARNGDYCIAPQGVVYGSLNLQGAAMLARILARQGDRSLSRFSTHVGLFGTQSAEIAKSMSLVATTYYKLQQGQLAWFSHEPWKLSQAPRDATSLSSTTVHYLGNAKALDDYHELGLLPVSYLLTGAPWQGWVMRDPGVTKLRFPGSTGNPVATGMGQWSDAFNAMPAVLLLRP